MTDRPPWPPEIPPEDLELVVYDLALAIADIAIIAGLDRQVAALAAKRGGPATALLRDAIGKARADHALWQAPPGGTAD